MPVYGRVDMVLKNISNIIETGYNGPIIIVNDNPSDESIHKLVDYINNSNQISLILNDDNIGYTKSINIGIKNSLTDYVLILNSDAFIVSNTIKSLEKIMLENPIFAGVGPLSDNAGNIKIDGLRQDWENMSSEILSELIKFIELSFINKIGPGLHITPNLNGFCTLWNREDLLNIGMFDEHNFPYGYAEEEDICIRLTNIGKLLALTTSSFVPHLRSASFSEDQKNYLKLVGNQILINKWGKDRINDLHKYQLTSPLFQSLQYFSK